MGKPIGNYITIESELLKENDITSHEEMMKVVANHINNLTKLNAKIYYTCCWLRKLEHYS